MQWARAHGIPTCTHADAASTFDDPLITKHTHVQWTRYRDAFDAEADAASAALHEDGAAPKRRRVTDTTNATESVHDELARVNHGTVGAIVYDSVTGVCMSACSSGGIWYVY